MKFQITVSEFIIVVTSWEIFVHVKHILVALNGFSMFLFIYYCMTKCGITNYFCTFSDNSIFLYLYYLYVFHSIPNP